MGREDCMTGMGLNCKMRIVMECRTRMEDCMGSEEEVHMSEDWCTVCHRKIWVKCRVRAGRMGLMMESTMILHMIRRDDSTDSQVCILVPLVDSSCLTHRMSRVSEDMEMGQVSKSNSKL